MNKLAKKIVALFFQGVLYAIPIFIPLYFIYSIFDSLDKMFKTWFGLEIPGLGLLSAFVLFAFVGWLGKTFITQPIQHKFHSWLEKAPFLKLIYSSVKDLLKAFVGKEKKFTKPVLVKVNTISNLEKIGFVTQEDLSDLGLSEEKVVVYFPHSYAFSGEMFVVSKEYVTPLDVKSAEIMKFILSAGVSKS